MLIENETIQTAKQKLGIRNAELIAEILHMEQFDSSKLTGCCPNPNHDDQHPSCSYDKKRFRFKCWSCGYKVDILDAYMATGSTFLEACEKLFQEANVSYDFTERGLKSQSRQYPNIQYADDMNQVYAYWGKRKISPKTIDYLGIRQDKEGNTVFQYFDLNDVLVMAKIRPSRKIEKGKPKCWWAPSDQQSILYNINKINAEQPLIITCGEGDCATAVECGFPNTVSINGGDGNTNWIGECWEWLQQFSEIVLIHDNDDPGRKFAKDVSMRLGEYRVKIAQVPVVHITEDGTKYKVKDLNELLFWEGPEAVRKVICEAKEKEISTVISYGQIRKFDMSEVDGFVTGFKELDSLLGKFYEGSTTLLTGITGSGKSSFLSSLICQSVEQGFPAFVYSGELDNAYLRNWVDSVFAGQRGVNQYYDALGSPYYKIKNSVYERLNEIYGEKIWFYRDTAEPKASSLLDTMESMIRKKGIKTFIIDNLTVVDLEENDKNKYIKQERFIRDIIDFSKRWKVICIIVLHPKKMESIRRMTLFDLQGVTASANLAHRILALYRVQEKDREGIRNKAGDFVVKPIKFDVLVDILKDRLHGVSNRTVGLYYDVPSRRFFDSAETLDRAFAWDHIPRDSPLPYGIPQLEGEREIYGTLEDAS